MALTEEDIRTIKEHLPQWLGASNQLLPVFALSERIVRVEEELRHQRELFASRFEAIDRRFEEMREDMNKRFEEMREDMDKRFDAMDRRFEELREDMDKRFEAMDRRFEAVDRRFELIEGRMERQFLWLVGLLVSLTGVILAALKWL